MHCSRVQLPEGVVCAPAEKLMHSIKRTSLKNLFCMIKNLSDNRNLNFFLGLKTLQQFNVQSVGQAGLHQTLFKDLWSGFHLHEHRVAAELQNLFVNGQHTVATVQHNIGTGTVAGTNKAIVFQLHGRFNFKLDGAAFLYTLGRNVFQVSIKHLIFDGPDGHQQMHALLNLPTSVSSTLPLKIISPISATMATVVPSLKLLLLITELPSSMGTSNTIPEMVERITVLVLLPICLVTPSCISCK